MCAARAGIPALVSVKRGDFLIKRPNGFMRATSSAHPGPSLTAAASFLRLAPPGFAAARCISAFALRAAKRVMDERCGRLDFRRPEPVAKDRATTETMPASIS